jgi:hypothetical protein
MRIFKTKWFARYARRERIKDSALREAVARADKGLIDADLRGGLIKQRVARAGEGRSGGYRTIMVYRAKDRAVFLYGFAKNERDNIEDDELVTFKELGAGWLQADSASLDAQVKKGLAEEVTDERSTKEN